MNKLEIIDLHVSVEDKEILKGVNLTINQGESLALLGPNGHGKSTLLAAIMGNPHYKVTQGKILLDGEDVLSMSIDERSKKGLFLAMQYPSEIPGVVNQDFLRASMNAHRDTPIKLFEFYRSVESASKKVNLPLDMVNRFLNEGFSGGEKKRNEILQLILLNPSIALLDEIDSGLDVDAINTIASVIDDLHQKGMSFLVVSHYARLYDLIHPTHSAIMINGKIVLEGDKTLIDRVDKEGYEFLKREHGIDIAKEEKKMNTVSLGACAVNQGTK